MRRDKASPAKGSGGGRIRWMIKPGAAGAAVETGSGIIPRPPVSGTARGKGDRKAVEGSTVKEKTIY